MTTIAPANRFALDELEFGEAWIDGDDTVRWRTNRLFDAEFPFSTGVATEALMGVYVEVDPGYACERHVHDVEEVLLVHRGTVKVTVEDDVTTHVAGEMSVVPADTPHGFRNVGEETAGVLGVLPTKEAITEFDRVVEPIGARMMGPNGPVISEGRDD